MIRQLIAFTTKVIAMTERNFADTPLTDDELPAFMKRAAERAYRKGAGWGVTQTAGTIGSPGFRPSPEQSKQVSKMAALGLKPKEIAIVLNINAKLLAQYYQYELKSAAIRTNVRVAKVALDMALSGQSETMTKFWLKARAGWQERDVIEHEGIDAAADEAKAARAKLLGDD